MNERIEKVKEHLRENKTVYLVGGLAASNCLALGAIAVLVWRGHQTAQTAKVIQGIAYKSPVTQHIIQQSIPRAGHAGKVIVDRDDPTVRYMSVRLMADGLGVSPKKIRRYLAGELPDLAGRQWDLVMDGAPPLVAQMKVAV